MKFIIFELIEKGCPENYLEERGETSMATFDEVAFNKRLKVSHIRL